MSKTKRLAGGAVCLAIIALAGWLWSQNRSANGNSSSRKSIDLCEQHGFGIDICYQCDPTLVSKFKSSLDWCNEHNLPESQCVLCDPFAKFKAKGDWCKEHGAPESQCVKCDPSLATAQPQFVDWCDEHAIAESQCTICDPKLKTSMKSDWCQEHGARDSECMLCHPELRNSATSQSSTGNWCEHGFEKGNCYRCDASLEAKFKSTGDWCGGHGLPESQCLKCQADVKAEVQRRLGILKEGKAPTATIAESDPKGNWCEHGFEEGNCYRCDASLEAKFKSTGDWCGGHSLPESQCLKCQPDVKAEVEKRLLVSTPRPELLQPSGDALVYEESAEDEQGRSKFCGTHLMRIKLSDPSIASKIGLKIEPARERRINQTIQANAELSYDRTRTAAIASRLGGTIERIDVTLGQKVKKGDVLAVIESLELGDAKVELANAASALAAATLVHDQILGLSEQTKKLLAAARTHSEVAALLDSWKSLRAGEAQSQLLAALTAREEASLNLSTVQKIYDRSKPVVENVRKLHAYLHSGSVTTEKALTETDGLEIGSAKAVLLKQLGSVELALSIFERQQKMLTENIGSKQAFLQAKNDHESALAEYRALLEETLVSADTDLAQTEGRLQRAKLEAMAAKSKFDSLVQELKVRNDRDVVNAKESLLAATSRVRSARNRLALLGLSQDEIDAVGSESDPGATEYVIRAPLDGTIIELKSVSGEMVEAGAPVLTVADSSTMWMTIDVRERDLPQLQDRENLPVRFVPDGFKGESFEGRLVWLGAELNDQTRTVQALAEIKNPDGLLKANMFGKASILVHRNEKAIVVPKQAVQWEGCCHVVFVQLKDDLYAPRKVRLGHEGKDFYEVKVGLLHADPIVTQGSFLLKTEILKSSIGAGCTD